MNKPDNVIRFGSENSAFTDFTIEQRHSTEVDKHDHVERVATSDGWSSTVHRNGTSVIRGPFSFMGDAIMAMKKWASEPTPTIADELNTTPDEELNDG